MDSNHSASPLAKEVAERILATLYGPDLTLCQVTPDALAPMIQEALSAQTKREQTIITVFVEVLEKIQLLSTPPPKSDVQDLPHLASILRERVDGIQIITSQTLSAWRKLNSQE